MNFSKDTKILTPYNSSLNFNNSVTFSFQSDLFEAILFHQNQTE